jgi:hypothetical protein
VEKQNKQSKGTSGQKAKKPAPARRRGGKKVVQSIVSAHRQQSKESPPDINFMVDEIFTAFCVVEEKYASLVEQFRNAFNERAIQSSLVESRGQDGLAFALEEFLVQYPISLYLQSPPPYPDDSSVDWSFKSQFRIALERVAVRNPRTLTLMWQIHKEIKWSLSDMLQALFAQYIHRKGVYPF